MKQYYQDMIMINGNVLNSELKKFKRKSRNTPYSNYSEEFLIEEIIVDLIAKSDEETFDWLVVESPLLQLIFVEDIFSKINSDDVISFSYHSKK